MTDILPGISVSEPLAIGAAANRADAAQRSAVETPLLPTKSGKSDDASDCVRPQPDAQRDQPSDRTAWIDEAWQLLALGLRPDLLGIAEPDATGESLVAALRYQGLVDHPHEALRVRLQTDAYRSLAGYCRHLEQVVFSPCLASEVRFRDRLLLEKGMTTALAAPLMFDNCWRGILFAATRAPRLFGIGDAVLLNSVSQLLAGTLHQASAAPPLTQLVALTPPELDACSSLVVSVDRSGKILDVNRTCEQLLNTTRKQLAGRDFADCFLAGEDAANLRAALLRPLANADGPIQTSRLKCAAGRTMHVEWRLAAAAATDAETERLLAIGQDVTDRAELHRLVQASHEEQASSAKRLAQPATGEERREHPRVQFPHTQLVAISPDGRLPSASEFHEVRCRDISSEGFSFLWPTPWRCDELLVAFDSGRKFAHLFAVVAHNTRIKLNSGRYGYAVGCRFVGGIAD